MINYFTNINALFHFTIRREPREKCAHNCAILFYTIKRLHFTSLFLIKGSIDLVVQNQLL